MGYQSMPRAGATPYTADRSRDLLKLGVGTWATVQKVVVVRHCLNHG